MPTAIGPEDWKGDGSPKLSLWHHVLLRMPHLDRGQGKPSLTVRLREAVMRPEDRDERQKARGAYELSGRELEIEEKRVNDKERAIGLLVGPLATLIAFLVIHELVASDPPARLSDGAINRLHVNVSTYSDLFLVLIVLSFGISAMALWRRRLYLGIVTSLYGLSIFNLHYWGFGVPFVMVGAWYLVRAYRLRRNLRESTASSAPSIASRPRSNKRYTPPSLPHKGLPPVKPRPEPTAD